MSAGSEVNQSRVDFRIPTAVKATLQEAALHENGGDLSAFLIAAGLERANRVLAAAETVRLNDTAARERFYAALRDDSPPSPALRRMLTEQDSRFHLVE